MILAYIDAIHRSDLPDKEGKAELLAMAMLADSSLQLQKKQATIRAISLKVGRSAPTVQRRIAALKDAGLLTITQHRRKAYYQLPGADVLEAHNK
jgi:hypothetical protein